jgi:hypothetical protein
MATIRWEVTPGEFFELAALLAEAEEVSQTGPESKAYELQERIRRFRGYPHNRTPEDVVVVVPEKGTNIYIAPEPKENLS